MAIGDDPEGNKVLSEEERRRIARQEIKASVDDEVIARRRERSTRPGPIIAAVVTIIIVAGVLYYFYGYRNRDISADIGTVKEYTEDVATTSAVKSALALHKQLSGFDIHVFSRNNPGSSGNDVTLTGRVPTEDDKRVAGEVARSTKGVANVVNNLEVVPAIQVGNPDKQSVTDLEIKAAVLQSILDNPGLKTQQIKVDVSNGTVRLIGTVQTPSQKTDAETVARAVANVREVDSAGLAVSNGAPRQP
jgi:osmotically-inducible protein OsmY